MAHSLNTITDTGNFSVFSNVVLTSGGAQAGGLVGLNAAGTLSGFNTGNNLSITTPINDPSTGSDVGGLVGGK